VVAYDLGFPLVWRRASLLEGSALTQGRAAVRCAMLEAEITRLNAVIETSHDALMHLQKVYSDPNAPVSDVIRAAGLAVGYERGKPPSVNASIDGTTLFSLLETKRLAKHKPAVIDLTPTTPAA
jgi:hypothetical protein